MANANSDLLLREKQEGHTIANHTFSHDYKYIYANPKNFVDDVNKGDAVIKSIVNGYNSKLIRFPGGSSGKEREPYRNAVTEAGYHYVDWNALNGDAEGNGNIPADKLVERLKQTVKGQKHLIVLMHDAPLKITTVQALPQIIEYLKANGYVFKTLE
jgi:peptidoglycan/xylan/chitin deacetylase (PgdA/CDA1 family)